MRPVIEHPVFYLDHMSATPVRPACLQAMGAAAQLGGNPSSPHGVGRAARRLMERAADAVCGAVHARTANVLWTGSGAEAQALAVLGLAQARARESANTVVLVGPPTDDTAPLEHALRAAGLQVQRSPDGRTLPCDAALVSLPVATPAGELLPLAEVCAAARTAGVPVHADLSWGFGQISCDFAALGLAAASFSGHKLGAPAGVGAVVLRKGLSLPALWQGGGQQRGMRPGTEPVPLVVGLGEAMATPPSTTDLLQHAAWCADLVGHARNLPRTWVPDPLGERLSGVTCIGVRRTSGVALAEAYSRHGVMVAPTELGQEQGVGVVRLSLGWSTTPEDIEAAKAALDAAVRHDERAA